MKKILIVAFYELKDYLLYIKEIFENYNFTVISYPLFRYAYDTHDKIDDYKEHMNEFIQDNDPDVILWWFNDVPVSVFKFIRLKNNHRMFILFNSDDPINLNKELIDKAKCFDVVFTPCRESVYLYKLHSNVNVSFFNPMGFDPSLFYPITNKDPNEFECDISMICYNLFFDKNVYPNQVVYKKDLIDNIINYCSINNYKFKLYGTPILNEFFPNNYCGEVPYYKLNNVFNYSKINIVSHPDSNVSLHISDNVFSILGSGGLLMIDKIKDVEKIFGGSAIIYDDNYLEQIDQILKNYDQFNRIKESGLALSKTYTWDRWVEIVIRKIGTFFFDKKIYSELYQLNESDDLLEFWRVYGMYQNEICYSVKVPPNFNAEDYIADNKLNNNNIMYAYIHWFNNSKNDSYLKKIKKTLGDNLSVDPTLYNCTMYDFYDIMSVLNKINYYHTRDIGLNQIGTIAKHIPELKINDIINCYFESTI